MKNRAVECGFFMSVFCARTVNDFEGVRRVWFFCQRQFLLFSSSSTGVFSAQDAFGNAVKFTRRFDRQMSAGRWATPFKQRIGGTRQTLTSAARGCFAVIFIPLTVKKLNNSASGPDIYCLSCYDF